MDWDKTQINLEGDSADLTQSSPINAMFARNITPPTVIHALAGQVSQVPASQLTQPGTNAGTPPDPVEDSTPVGEEQYAGMSENARGKQRAISDDGSSLDEKAHDNNAGIPPASNDGIFPLDNGARFDDDDHADDCTQSDDGAQGEFDIQSEQGDQIEYAGPVDWYGGRTMTSRIRSRSFVLPKLAGKETYQVTLAHAELSRAERGFRDLNPYGFPDGQGCASNCDLHNDLEMQLNEPNVSKTLEKLLVQRDQDIEIEMQQLKAKALFTEPVMPDTYESWMQYLNTPVFYPKVHKEEDREGVTDQSSVGTVGKCGSLKSLDEDEKKQEAAKQGRRQGYAEATGQSLSTMTYTDEMDQVLELLQVIDMAGDHHPMKWPLWMRWCISLFYCLIQVFITLTSTSYLGVAFQIQHRFGVSLQMAVLGQSLYVLGQAFGPAMMGPISDSYGRKWVYFFSILWFGCFNFYCILMPNFPMLMVLQLLNGWAGSTSVTNVMGTITDLFGDGIDSGYVVGVFTLSANIGPTLGAPIGYWIAHNAKMGYPWIFILNCILSLAFVLVLPFMPETLPLIIMSKAVHKYKIGTKRQRAIVNLQTDFWEEWKSVVGMTFYLLRTEVIILVMALYNGFTYGLMFLYLAGLPKIYKDGKGMSGVTPELTYLSFLVGSCLMLCFLPLQQHYRKLDARKHRNSHPNGRPEGILFFPLFYVWGFPIALFWLAFTSGPGYSAWHSIVAVTLLAFVNPLLWWSMLMYLTETYPHAVNSTMAAFFVPSFAIAAGTCHVGIAMFDNLTVMSAFVIVGSISVTLVGMIYYIYFSGEKLREHSKVTRSF